MGSYLVERFVPSLPDELSTAAAASDEAVGDDLAARGSPGRHVRTICVPEDETCFSVFEAPSAGDVAAALERAGVHFDRITEAFEMEHGPAVTEGGT